MVKEARPPEPVGLLEDTEVVIESGPGTWMDLVREPGVNAGPGTLFATDRRLIFCIGKPDKHPPPRVPADVLARLHGFEVNGLACADWRYELIKHVRVRSDDSAALQVVTRNGDFAEIVGDWRFLRSVRRVVRRGRRRARGGSVVRRGVATAFAVVVVGALVTGGVLLDRAYDRADRIEAQLTASEDALQEIAAASVSRLQDLDGRVGEVERQVFGTGFSVRSRFDTLSGDVEDLQAEIDRLRRCVNSLINDLTFGSSFLVGCR